MSLDFDVSQCADTNDLTHEIDGEKHWTPMTQAVVFGMMAIGQRNISEGNLTEVADRFWIWQKHVTPLLGNADGTVFITILDLKAYVSLTTNVSPIGKAAFDKKVALQLRKEAESARRTILTNA